MGDDLRGIFVKNIFNGKAEWLFVEGRSSCRHVNFNYERNARLNDQVLLKKLFP